MTVSDSDDNPEIKHEELPTPEEMFALNRQGQALISAVQPLLGAGDLDRQTRFGYRGFGYTSEDLYLGSLNSRVGRFFSYPPEIVDEEGVGGNEYHVAWDHIHFGDELLSSLDPPGHKGIIIIFEIGDRWRHDALGMRIVVIPDEYPPYMREIYGVQQSDGGIHIKRFSEAKRLLRSEVLALSEDLLRDTEAALKFRLENPDFVTS